MDNDTSSSPGNALPAPGFTCNADPQANQTKNMGVPLNDWEQALFAELESHIRDELAAMGAKVSRRSLARAWLVERIKQEAQKRGLL